MEFIESSQFKSILELNETLNKFRVTDVTQDYKVLNPIQFFTNQGGTNWDYCIAEAHKLVHEIGIPSVQCYSLEIGDEFINFITFKNELFWYWFESSDKEEVGIHRFNSWVRMINFITHKYGTKKSNFKLGLRQINPLDGNVFGMDENSYKRYILNSPIISIRDTKIEDPVNYINENGVMRKYSDTSKNGVEYENDDSVDTRTLTDENPNNVYNFHKNSSANFRRGMSFLKTKRHSSINQCWDRFVRRFSGEMSDSVMAQYQLMLQKAKTLSKTPQEKIAGINEAKQFLEESKAKGYLDTPMMFSDNDPNRNASTNNEPPKPSNMDHESHSNGRTEVNNNNSNDNNSSDISNHSTSSSPTNHDYGTYTTKASGLNFEHLGQTGGTSAVQEEDEPDDHQDDTQHQQPQQPQPQQQQAQQGGGGTNWKRMVGSLGIGFLGRSLGRLAAGAIF